METTGLWGSMHVIGAGGASIFMYDVAHQLVSGLAAVMLFGALSLAVMHIAHHKHKQMHRRTILSRSSD